MPVGTEPFFIPELFIPDGAGVVPLAADGALIVRSGVSNRDADVLSTDGCLDPANELLNLPVALEYLEMGKV